MKKQTQRPKKRKTPKKKDPASSERGIVTSNRQSPQKKPVKQRPVREIAKKATERKEGGDRSITHYVTKAGRFLRESRVELKKVKWPTRKELLASTAVVIVLTLLVAFFLGLVDFGLIKIIKNIVG
jgi:preprotein translocase subunit SecE